MAKIARPMQVRNTDFLVTKVAEGLPPTQLLRELTQNAFDAADGPLTVRWSYDHSWLARHGTYKLSVEDTGTGMTRDELEQGIGDFASSGRVQAVDLNFGIGAKIASVASSPTGLLYRTWTTRVDTGWTAMLTLTGGRIGLADLGSGEHIQPIGWKEAPDLIRKAGHGTAVTLLGNSLEEDSTLPPKGLDHDQNNNRWVGQALARRYFHLPKGVRLEALESHPASAVKPRQLRQVYSQQAALTQRSRAAGTCDIGDALVHWWILAERGNARSSVELLNLVSGHVGLLWLDELYAVWPFRRRGATLLQNFGISVGGRNVVLYVEPKAKVATANIQRTGLVLRSGQDLPLEEWAERFVQRMPAQLREYVSAHAAQATFDEERLSRRLHDVLSTLSIGRFIRNLDGGHQLPGARAGADTSSLTGVDADRTGGANITGSVRGAGKLSTAVAAAQGAARPQRVTVPTVFFCSERIGEVGGAKVRPLDEFGAGVDRAATYRMSSNTLYINLDFRAYRAVEEHLAGELLSTQERKHHPDAGESLIRPHLLDCYVFNLVEAVVTIRQLAASGRWPRDEESAALTPESLTLAAMQRASLIPDARQAYRSRS